MGLRQRWQEGPAMDVSFITEAPYIRVAVCLCCRHHFQSSASGYNVGDDDEEPAEKTVLGWQAGPLRVCVYLTFFFYFSPFSHTHAHKGEKPAADTRSTCLLHVFLQGVIDKAHTHFSSHSWLAWHSTHLECLCPADGSNV